MVDGLRVAPWDGGVLVQLIELDDWVPGAVRLRLVCGCGLKTSGLEEGYAAYRPTRTRSCLVGVVGTSRQEGLAQSRRDCYSYCSASSTDSNP